MDGFVGALQVLLFRGQRDQRRPDLAFYRVGLITRGNADLDDEPQPNDPCGEDLGEGVRSASVGHVDACTTFARDRDEIGPNLVRREASHLMKPAMAAA